ncbi:MAG: glycosyltransferase [Deltaproteobacteria bacterium]|nr:glycosyltransferase [Deltaproteobacteria bacterium]
MNLESEKDDSRKGAKGAKLGVPHTLAILTTHPIQYQVPIWQELARRNQIDFEVWYLSDHGSRPSIDPGFTRTFQWDLPMLDGYPYRFLDTRPHPADITSVRGARLGSLATLFRDRSVTALWINGWNVQAYWQAAFQAHRAGIPVWLRGESNDLHRPRWFKKLPRKILLAMLFQRVSYFLYVGSANRRLYQQFGISEDQLVSAPYCVDNQRFAQAAQEWNPRRSELRRAWRIPDQATCFLYSGKFICKKRPLDIFEAASRLLLEDRTRGAAGRLYLLMVGDGMLRQELQSKADALERLCGRPIVSFAGFINQQEMPKAYVASDCLILPSDSLETWGLVVNEALACGRPALVSDQCGCAEDLAKPLGGDFVFKCGDVNELAGLMRKRTGGTPSSDERKKYYRLVNQFDIAGTVKSIEFLYKSLQAPPFRRKMAAADENPSL